MANCRGVNCSASIMLLFLCFAATFAETCRYQFRRDYYLSDWTYPEPWAPDPTTGGRLHLVVPIDSPANVDGPFVVNIGGYQIPIEPSCDITKLTGGNVQWIHFEASNPSFSPRRGILSLHSPTDAWLTSIQNVSVANSNGGVIGSCNAAIGLDTLPLLITYVTSRNKWSELVIHVHNFDSSSPHVASKFVVNGEASEITATTIPSLGHQVFVVQLSTALAEGATWTAELLVDGASWTANGGRLGKEVMFVEGWQHSSSCPFPVAGGQANDFHAFHDVLGMNAFYGFSACSSNYLEVLANASANDYYIMLPNVINSPLIADTSRLMCVEAGDEVDNKLTDTMEQWKKVLKIRKKYPNTVVYEGGKTNHWAGAFAGISDIQGIDFYIAACAPHITPALTPMVLSGSHDYIRNYRNNHMPLTTWGYSQAICTNCWNTVPNSADFTIQIASAFAAGAKSLLLFMADEAAIGLQAFADGGSLIRSFSAVKEVIRTGDVQGATMTVDPAAASVMMETIAAPNNTFVLIVANTQAGGYSDLLCEIGADNHWVFQAQQIGAVTAIVTPSSQAPNPSRVAAAYEAVDGRLQPLPSGGVSVQYDSSRAALVVSNFSLGVNIVARIFYVQLI